MAKLKTPLTSFDASGNLGNSMVYSKRHHQAIAEAKSQPLDAKSAGQLSWRTMFEKCTLLWHTLSATEKTTWEKLGTARHMTGYALWQSQCLRPNPGVYLPLAGGIMSGTIDMDSHFIQSLNDPLLNQDADTKAARNAAITASIYTQGARVYHSVNQVTHKNTDTRLNFDSQRYDTNNIHDPALSLSALFCRTAGKYLIVASILWAVNADGYRWVYLLWNNTNIIADISSPPGIFDFSAMCVSTIYNLAVDDYIYCFARQSSNGDLNVIAQPNYSPEFMMQRIG